MSSYPDPNDEFKKVKKGLPEENTSQKAKTNFITIFIVVGLLFAAVVLIFREPIQEANQSMGRFTQQIVNGIVFSLLVGSIQAWIFKAHVRSRINLFLVNTAIGGLAGGFVGGIFLYFTTSPWVIGGIIGLVGGFISSLLQNQIMHNSKYGSKWTAFNALTWMVIYSVTWAISWELGQVNQIAGMVLAVIFLMIASGIALVVFLNNNPQIEFS
jgi:hypothetical protein